MKTLSIPLLLGVLLATGPVCAQENISKVSGSISAEPGQRYGKLDTVNGGIRVGEGVETGSIDTVNGGVKVADRARTGKIETVNGGVRLGREVIASGGVSTVNGSIFTDRGSQIEGGVETVNGGIGLVEPRRQDVETVNGDITVGIGSQVSGGVHVRKPNFSVSLTASRKPRVIIGECGGHRPLQFEREVVLYVHRSARIGPVTGAEPIRSTPIPPRRTEPAGPAGSVILTVTGRASGAAALCSPGIDDARKLLLCRRGRAQCLQRRNTPAAAPPTPCGEAGRPFVLPGDQCRRLRRDGQDAGLG